MISHYTREPGVRELERQLATLCRVVAERVAQQLDADLGEISADDPKSAEPAPTLGPEIAAEELLGVLGPSKFDGPRDNAQRLSKPGVAIGLAYTAVGGDVLFVEAEAMGGKGSLQMTGRLGKTMQESARTALSWIRSHATELELADTKAEHLLNTTDLHLHFPAGAIPKDGPSAGVAITSALVSLLTGRLVRSDVAMTGEVSLRGMVLPVGGIKEKVTCHIRTVLLLWRW